MSQFCDDYYIHLDGDDDAINCSQGYVSSDSDVDISAFISSEVSRKKTFHKRKPVPEPDDDFANEMSQELATVMKSLTKPLVNKLGEGACAGPSSSSSSAGVKKKVKFAEETKPQGEEGSAPEYYDDIYFDTDDSEGDEEIPPNIQKKKEKRRFLTDDELFYDPKMDQEDEDWVNKRRRSYHLKPNSKLVVDGTTIPLPPSDAVLDCPACFTTLCHDCQRHEIYQNQYRAMFVFNCKIDFSEKLHIPQKKKKKSKKKQQSASKDVSQSDPNFKGESPPPDDPPTDFSSENFKEAESNFDMADVDTKDIFYPVRCQICNTKVGVYDQDEVYHFFNILTSY